MKNKHQWQPSKYVVKDGRLIGSRDPRNLAVSSRLVGDIVAGFYWTYLKQYCEGRLLDLGCGEVPLYGVYRDLIDDNVCVDWANTPHQNLHIDEECDLTDDLPFPAGSFDTVILSSVLEHLPEPFKVWQEISRVLKPGGKLLLDVPFYYCLHETPHDYYRYTEYALERLASATGFKVLVLERTGGVPEILADTLAKNLNSLRYIGRPCAIAAQSIIGILLKTRIGTRISTKSAVRFPLGYFVVVKKL